MRLYIGDGKSYGITYYPPGYMIEIEGQIHVDDIHEFWEYLKGAAKDIMREIEKKEKQTNKTRWLCERCDTTGCVTMEPDEGVMSGLYKIEDDHKAKSPTCEISMRGLRIIR